MNIKELLPQANHIYVDVTEAEMSSITVERYVTTYKDQVTVGTKEPVEALAGKELVVSDGMVFG
jgi:hypothetical protein